jgi:hypothetical protein
MNMTFKNTRTTCCIFKGEESEFCSFISQAGESIRNSTQQMVWRRIRRLPVRTITQLVDFINHNNFSWVQIAQICTENEIKCEIDGIIWYGLIDKKGDITWEPHQVLID